jgi:hypothetical protein
MMPRALLIGFSILLLGVIGAGIYLVTLKRNAEQAAQRVDTRPLTAPVAGPTQHVVLYEADDHRGSIKRLEVDITVPEDRSERDRQVLHALLADYVNRPSTHELAAGADVRSVYLLPNHIAVIDTTPQFADGHRSGVLVEILTVASLVQTLAANEPDVERVKILVDGKERESLAGHADLTCFYHVGQVAELVKQLQ